MTKNKTNYFAFSLPIETTNIINVVWTRFVIFTLIGWYLLSRDFTSMANIPESVLDISPSHIKGYLQGRYIFTSGTLIDIVSFHWVHWVLPMPRETMLEIIQVIAIISCFSTALFGRGPYGLFAIPAVVSFLYFHGFIWRSDALYDGLHLPLQIAILYLLMKPKEVSVFNKKNYFQSDHSCHVFMSAVVFAFVLYYFFSGFNKLVDINLSEWFTYELYQSVIDFNVLSEKTNHFAYTPSIFKEIVFHPVFNYLVPIVYISHLLTPLILLNPKKWLSFFAVFYVSFHIFSSGINIFFFGTTFTWLALAPVNRLNKKFKTSKPIKAILCVPFDFVKNFLLKFNFITSKKLNQAPDFLRALRKTLGTTDVSFLQKLLIILIWTTMGAVWIKIAYWQELHDTFSPLTNHHSAYAFALLNVLAIIVAILPNIGALWINGLYRLKIWAMAPMMILASVGNFFITTQAFHSLLWISFLFPYLILWAPLAYKFILKQTSRAQLIAALFIAITIGAYTLPGFAILPLSEGINGWDKKHDMSKGAFGWGLALVRDDGERVWLSPRITDPNYSPLKHYLGISRNAQWLKLIGQLKSEEEIDNYIKNKVHDMNTLYLNKYRQAWPHILKGRFPHQKYLGDFAIPTHNLAKNDPEEYLDFPPDRILSIVPQLIIYNRETGAQEELHFYPPVELRHR